MAEQVCTTRTDEMYNELTRLHPVRRPNPSALPISPATLNVLLVSTIISVEFRQNLPQYDEWTETARLAVYGVYRRLTATERFRLHSALIAHLSYVPTWVQEIVE
jgi:hypothetical protein